MNIKQQEEIDKDKIQLEENNLNINKIDNIKNEEQNQIQKEDLTI